MKYHPSMSATAARLHDWFVFGLAGFCIAWSIVKLVELLK